MAHLFLICITAVFALDVASSLRIVKVERATSEADANKFTVSIHYDQAQQEPEAEWTVINYSQNPPHTVLQGAMTYSSQDKSGVASVHFNKTVDNAKVRLGRIGSHYTEFYLNVGGDKDATLTHDVNFVLSTITPGTDVAYKASDGQTNTVTVVTPPVSSDSDLTRYTKGIYLIDNVLNKTTGQVELTVELGLQYVQTSWTEDEPGTLTNTFTFETDVNVLNGYYSGDIYYGVSKSSSPISYSISELIILLVHEDSNQGPFPDDFLKVEMDEKSKGCIQQRSCYVGCQAFGNDIQSLQIYQATAEGGEVDLGADLYQDVGGYRWSANVNLEGSPSSLYVCRVKQGDLEATDTMQLLQLETEARVDSLTYEFLDGGKVNVTCEGSGSQPLEVRLTWGDYVRENEEFKEKVKGVVSYTPGQAGGDAVATAILDATSLEKPTIVCEASNPASTGIRVLYTSWFSK